MEPILQVKHLSYQYPDMKQRAVDDVSFELFPGEWVAIIGSNGSGKSTLVRLLNGLLAKTTGDIIVDGLPLKDETIYDIRAKIGMVFQNPDNQFVGATVENDVAFGLENQGIPYEKMHQIVKHALTKVNMLSFKTEEPARLSGGQKQRVALASVLALEPDLLILDEATSMLDPRGKEEVLQAIMDMHQQTQMTLLSITHDLNEIAQADRVLVMQKGHLVFDGTPTEIFQNEDLLAQYGLDIPFTTALKAKLMAQGIKVPTEYQTEEELLQWLISSNSSK